MNSSRLRAAAGLAVGAWIALSCAEAADAAVVTKRFAGVAAEPLDGGAAVVRFDLSAIPEGAEVYRARLRLGRQAVAPSDPRALEPVEIVPLAAVPSKAEDAPRAGGPPLALVGPWYTEFDATGLVGRAAGTGAAGVLVKRLAGWRPDRALIDVAYEGMPGEVPPQASGIEVFHRAGQTFITWREAEPLVAGPAATWGEIKRALEAGEGSCRYRIYAHDRPIDTATVAQADLLAEVEPLSGFNVNGRNMEYLIGQAMVEPEEMGELARDYNGYMYTWGMDSPRMDRFPVSRFVVRDDGGPLEPGRGLYVHSPSAPGRRFYAVVACREGVENLRDFSPQNSLGRAVEETVGPGRPVRQGPGLWGPYFDYPGRRQVYVQWCAPPLAPRPNMYFNWSVLVPPDLKDGEKAPVELHLHTGNFSYAKPRQKYIRGSIQIAPHDYPFSGWYGFNDVWGTLRSWQEGVVRNHTQRRIIAFMEWAEDALPVDPERIILCGHDGAAVMAMDHRAMFAYVLIDGVEGRGEVYGRILDPDEAPKYAAAWGPQSPLVKDERGRASWAWAMLDRLALEQPETSMPLLVCRGGSWGGKRGYGKAFGPFYDALQKARQPFLAGFGWDYGLVTPDYYTALWQPRKHYDSAAPLDLTRTTPVPALAGASTGHEKLQSGNINAMHTWADLSDEPDRFEIRLTGPGTLDLTPRRLQQFRVRPGQRLRWATEPLPDRRDPAPPQPQSGTLTVDAQGLFTIPRLNIPNGGVIVKVTRAD